MKLLWIHIAKLTFCLFGVLFISVIQYIQGCTWAGGGGWKEQGAKVPLGPFYLLPLERHPVSLWPLVISHVCWGELFCSCPYKPLQVQLTPSPPVSAQAQETFSTSAAGYPVDLLKILHHLWVTLCIHANQPISASPWGWDSSDPSFRVDTPGNEATDLPCYQLPKSIWKVYFFILMGRETNPQVS